MTLDRYLELLKHGPVLNEEDVKRLAGFELRPTKCAFSVRWALLSMRKR